LTVGLPACLTLFVRFLYDRKSRLRIVQDQRAKPGVLDDLAKQRAESLEKESAELEARAEKLAEEIVELGGKAPARIG